MAKIKGQTEREGMERENKRKGEITICLSSGKKNENGIRGQRTLLFSANFAGVIPLHVNSQIPSFFPRFLVLGLLGREGERE